MQEWFTKKFVIVIALFLVVTMGGSVWYLSKKVEENRYVQFSDTLRNYFRNGLNSQKSQALSLAIALAENKALKEALWDDDEDRGYEILSKSLARLREYTLMRDVRAQVITTDLTIFARSWDNTYAGMPLDIFREDLKAITTLKKPKVAIEPGRLLSIKATTPIMHGAKAIGYLEILQFFDKITDDLRRNRIELLVLMNEKLLSIATLMRENPTVQNYVVSNKNYNTNLLKIVERVDMPKLLRQRYLYHRGHFFIVEEMLDGRGDQIGLFLMALSKEDLDQLMNGDKPLSFFLNFTQKDLYQIVNRWEDPTGGYRSIYDRNLFKLLNTFQGEDRMLVEQEIYEVLKEYSKEELIDIILYQNRRRKITGVIE
ncbi:cache domain-containing protein [Hydrogenimonas cancrithermarum]|uniref:Double Cache domain-containing protein n=1 Tax=Hydrogenimonas cancrithermarum TaxID=2993563 RepID=A0ABN6WUN3_9BACT|nr:cache domain-containing protein [Hydrogenimonas cancrithermarum]BDY12623.1 hypothetical protein HCR_09350 [Hydrogenimonas cancrithermarum]